MAAAPVALVNVARQIQNVFERSPSGLMFPASCLFCHACQSCDTSSSDICPDFVLYAEMHFLAIVQSRLVQNIPSYIDIIQLA